MTSLRWKILLRVGCARMPSFCWRNSRLYELEGRAYRRSGPSFSKLQYTRPRRYRICREHNRRFQAPNDKVTVLYGGDIVVPMRPRHQQYLYFCLYPTYGTLTLFCLVMHLFYVLLSMCVLRFDDRRFFTTNLLGPMGRTMGSG